ncbi:MAG TPA: hypothetical protein VFS02_13080 [Telluria sp.]|nr:hypothetical protein [Telluria sp.]
MRGGDKMAEVDGGTREAALALAARVRKRPGGPRIAAVINRRCFSTCMNFVQQIRSMGDTVILGQPTLGYSPYGAISLPSAIYAALQATREPFIPDLPYPGNIADESALMKWVAATLAKPKPRARHEPGTL